MIYVTTEYVPGYEVDKAICVVSGCIAYSSNGVQVFSASLTHMSQTAIENFRSNL